MIARILVALIRVYQRTLSPLLGNVCRFEPSCSRYAVACLKEHGALRGGLLSLGRLCKCHPFHPGGYDPPPLKARTSPPRLGPDPHARLNATSRHGPTGSETFSSTPSSVGGPPSPCSESNGAI